MTTPNERLRVVRVKRREPVRDLYNEMMNQNVNGYFNPFLSEDTPPNPYVTPSAKPQVSVPKKTPPVVVVPKIKPPIFVARKPPVVKSRGALVVVPPFQRGPIFAGRPNPNPVQSVEKSLDAIFGSPKPIPIVDLTEPSISKQAPASGGPSSSKRTPTATAVVHTTTNLVKCTPRPPRPPIRGISGDIRNKYQQTDQPDIISLARDYMKNQYNCEQAERTIWKRHNDALEIVKLLLGDEYTVALKDDIKEEKKRPPKIKRAVPTVKVIRKRKPRPSRRPASDPPKPLPVVMKAPKKKTITLIHLKPRTTPRLEPQGSTDDVVVIPNSPEERIQGNENSEELHVFTKSEMTQ